MRTKEEIENELRVQQEYRDKHVANIAALEAELAALPVPPVELAMLRTNDEGDHKVFRKGGNYFSWLATVDGVVCARHGIDPAHFAAYIAAYKGGAQ